MVGFLGLPIRLVGIVLMVAFAVRAMEPLRSMQVTLGRISTDPGSAVTGLGPVAVAPSNDGSSLLLSLGLGLIAIIAIWLIYQTWQQHIGLANGELRNRRTRAKS